jgi:hypothetical protein
MLNLKTNTIINSHDNIWLKKMHKDWTKTMLSSFLEEEEAIELPTGKQKMKVNEISTNMTEDKNK